ncbi:cold-shock protein [Pseudomonas sp. FFUP_PS_473]|jgi:CspA family cold shock protein|uniref:cold-shock protein n=1 Tax=unclassified Pseudomonas TaxID=196821 RepID=UPI000C1946E1|nr:MULTISPECIES: cold-shock protein [unclassified Pseudomonas]ATR82185.1 cold-shock protein [Pseudomonas sp. HLS-6]PLP87804.1 cold-shock protein [Pseudomonas sp. FFUP_PS_473]WJM98603.1 cold-shock protein [Pseudomonas defluvii]
MFKIVHILTGAAALLLSLIPSLRADAAPFLQQPDAVYLALFGLLNLTLAPVATLPRPRQHLQQLASALLVLAVVLQTITLLARQDMGSLPALICAVLAVITHLIANLVKTRPLHNQAPNYDMSNRDTGTVKWFNTSKGFGFISRDSGDDIFVHFRAIRGEGHRVLVEGQRVEFSVMNRDKGLQAEDVIAAPRR